MIDILSLCKTRHGIIILSVLWGLALATLFGYSCQNGTCIVFKAPKHEEIIKETYKHDNKCYKFETENTTCIKETINH